MTIAPRLDSRFPGEWLAAYGLSTLSPGRWTLCADGEHYGYTHDAGCVVVGEIIERLETAAHVPERSRWLNHTGQGTARRTIAGLVAALLELGVEEVDLTEHRSRRPMTVAGAGWMIDETWRRAPGALAPARKVTGDSPSVPLVEASLAMVGALYRPSGVIGEPPSIDLRSLWPRPGAVLCGLWHGPSGLPVTVRYERASRPSEAHAGALGMGVIVPSPPAEDWSPDSHLREGPPPGPGVTPVGLAEIATRLKRARPTVDSWRTRGDLPPSDWTVGGRPAWDLATIEAWARETGRLPAADQ